MTLRTKIAIFCSLSLFALIAVYAQTCTGGTCTAKSNSVTVTCTGANCGGVGVGTTIDVKNMCNVTGLPYTICPNAVCNGVTNDEPSIQAALSIVNANFSGQTGPLPRPVTVRLPAGATCEAAYTAQFQDAQGVCENYNFPHSHTYLVGASATNPTVLRSDPLPSSLTQWPCVAAFGGVAGIVGMGNGQFQPWYWTKYPINQVNAGDTTVTLTTAGNAANFSVGDYVKIWNCDPAVNHNRGQTISVVHRIISKVGGVLGLGDNSLNPHIFFHDTYFNPSHEEAIGAGNCVLCPTCSPPIVDSFNGSPLIANASTGNSFLYDVQLKNVVVTGLPDNIDGTCTHFAMLPQQGSSASLTVINTASYVVQNVDSRTGCNNQPQANDMWFGLWDNVTVGYGSPNDVWVYEAPQSNSGGNTYNNIHYSNLVSFGNAEYIWYDTYQNSTINLPPANVGSTTNAGTLVFGGTGWHMTDNNVVIHPPAGYIGSCGGYCSMIGDQYPGSTSSARFFAHATYANISGECAADQCAVLGENFGILDGINFTAVLLGSGNIVDQTGSASIQHVGYISGVPQPVVTPIQEQNGDFGWNISNNYTNGRTISIPNGNPASGTCTFQNNVTGGHISFSAGTHPNGCFASGNSKNLGPLLFDRFTVARLFQQLMRNL